MAAMMVLIFVCFYFIDNSETKCTSSLSDDLSGVHYSALETNGMFGVLSSKSEYFINNVVIENKFDNYLRLKKF